MDDVLKAALINAAALSCRCEMEGLIAANTGCAHRHEEPSYGSADFTNLAADLETQVERIMARDAPPVEQPPASRPQDCAPECPGRIFTGSICKDCGFSPAPPAAPKNLDDEIPF